MDAFYSNKDIDLDKMKEIWDLLESRCNYTEIMWLFRNFVYEAIRWSSDSDHGPVYDEGRTRLNTEQANRLQQQISSVVDLFTQSVVSKREFDEGYLKQYAFAAPYLSIIEDLKRKIEILEEGEDCEEC